MTYRIERCQCGHASCKDWHVHPVAAVQCVKFTEEQAAVTAVALAKLDGIKGLCIRCGSTDRKVVDQCAFEGGGIGPRCEWRVP
jgi:hypothetical protein